MFEPGIKISFGILCLYGTYKFIRACEDGRIRPSLPTTLKTALSSSSAKTTMPPPPPNK